MFKVGTLQSKICFHVAECCCGQVGSIRHMKQRSLADRLRGVKTLAVPHRSRFVTPCSRQRSGALTVCFPKQNNMCYLCARLPAELVGAWHPFKQKRKQVFLKVVVVCSSRSTLFLFLSSVFVSLKVLSIVLSLSLSLSLSFAFPVSLALPWSTDQDASVGDTARKSKSRSVCFVTRFCVCLRSAQ